jgi:hypothetical protein
MQTKDHVALQLIADLQQQNNSLEERLSKQRAEANSDEVSDLN